MAAYVLVNIEVHDPDRYAEYIRIAPATVAKYQGRYVARGGRTERLEGDWRPRRVVVLEFPTYDLAKAWWSSEEYRGPKALRQATASTDMVLVEGV